MGSTKSVTLLFWLLKARTVQTLRQINITTTLFLILTPIIGIYGAIVTPFVLNTYLFAFLWFLYGQFSIGLAYHRHFSHRTFDLSRPMEFFFVLGASGTFSMSAIDWVSDHRSHHKYTDTDKDPYNIKRGFWWAHLGWLVYKREKDYSSDISDLTCDPFLVFQHKYFIPLSFFMGWIIPTFVCGYLWGDYVGGFYVAGILRTFIQHHCIFCINSLAHWWGDTPYADELSPKENLLCAVITLGEGYHNFHHEFPNDYRNGVHFTAFDPTKWVISFFEMVGLATNLKRTDPDQIRLSKIQMIQKKLERQKKFIFTGRPIEALPFYTKKDVVDRCLEGEQLLIEGDLIFDVSPFVELHPGGKDFILRNVGKDITKSFNGGIYGHSNSAKNILQTLRCGRLSRTEIVQKCEM